MILASQIKFPIGQIVITPNAPGKLLADDILKCSIVMLPCASHTFSRGRLGWDAPLQRVEMISTVRNVTGPSRPDSSSAESFVQ